MGAAQNEGTVVDLQLDHPYLRNCKTKTTANSVQILATVPSQSGIYKKWKEQLQDLSSSIQTQYLLLPQTHRFEEGGVCSTTGELHLQYENYPRLLSTEIQSRKKQEKKITQGQLWYLLYVITMSKHQLSQRGQNLGDLHPRNIFLNQRGDIKLTCLTSWPSQLSNYRRAVLDQDYGYLAPQDIQRLKLGAMDNKNNTQAEIFTVGLVLLSCGLLTTHQDLYGMREREFQDAIFYAKVSKFQKDRTYSEIFRAVVCNLLEIEPLKRMTLFELKSFLTKHAENIIAKRHLFIDNVGKKLQFTINQMLNVIKLDSSQQKLAQNQRLQGNLAQKPQLPKTNSPIPSPPINNHDKIISFINYQEKKPTQSHISHPPLPVYTGKNEVDNHLPSSYHIKGYPSPKQANAAILNNKLPLISEQQPHKPVISKAFSSNHGPIIKKTQSYQINSPAKYKPFQTITIKNQFPPVQQTIKQTINLNFAPQQQEKKIVKTDPKLFQPQERIIQQSSVKQIIMHMQKSVANEIWQGQQTSIRQLNMLIDTKKQGFFEHGSLINPKYQPQSIQPQSLHRQASLSKQEVVEEPEEEEHASYISHPHDSQNHHQQSVVQEQSEENLSQARNQLSQMGKSQLQQKYNQSRNNSSISKTGSFGHQIIKGDINLQTSFGNDERSDDKKDKQLKVVEQQPTNQIQVFNLVSHNEQKPMATLVKVWGMNMKINQTQNNLPNQNAVNVRQYQTTQESLSKRTESQHQISQKCPTNKQQSLSHSSQTKLVEQTAKREFILIQQDSKHGSSSVKNQKQFVRPNGKDKQIIRLQQVEHVQQEQDQSEALDFHTYCETVTDGSFQDCWRQIMLFLNDPSDYSTLINPKKVRMRILPMRWSLNVGPAIFDIIINKEEGKFLLKNCEESRCKGWMLGGVYKDEQKRHRVWFNSAYYYKNVKIPSKQIIEDCLKSCKQNILKHKKLP